jgi:hypothetical protein
MVLANDLTWVLDTTGVVLNDGATTPFIDIYSAKGFNSAPFRTTQRDHEGDDGGYMDAEFEKGRDIVLNGTLYADTSIMENTLDTLKANWAPSTTLIPLYFKAPGVNERFLYVKPLGVNYDWSVDRRLGIADVQFLAFAEDPRIYESTLLTRQIFLGATVFTGFNFNFSFNFSFGGVSTTTDQETIIVGGNRPTPPIFEIHGPVSNPRILNDVTGTAMTFSGIDLGVTDTLTVDTKNKTVKLNGTANRRNTLVAPTWFYLQPGNNTIRYQASSADPSSFMYIYYRPAWR